MNDKQRAVLSYIENKKINNEVIRLFVHGKAGTGKSYLINEIFNIYSQKELYNIIKTSYNGIAAYHINGKTIHRTFNINTSPNKEEDYYTFTCNFTDISITINNKKEEITSQKPFHEKDLRDMYFDYYNKKNLLIIDEISTLSKKLFDFINESLKKVFSVKDLFGGINIIIVGDIFQLNPVSSNKLFFENNFIKDFDFIELDQIMRQDDEEFIEICNKVRINNISIEDIKQIKSRDIKNDNIIKSFDNLDTTYIYPRNDDVNSHNKVILESISEKKFKIDSEDVFPEIPEEYTSIHKYNYNDKIDYNGLLKNIEICIGAKVIITRNSYRDDIYNGLIGKVIEITTDSKDKVKHVIIVTNDGDEKIISRVTDSEEFQFSKINTNEKTKKKTIVYKNFPVFSRAMFPIKLAWALTTHKSQSLTLDKVVLDVGTNNFGYGQIYVGITRVKRFEDIAFINTGLVKHNIKVNKKCIKFINDNKMNIIK